ncbi:hypothetical protein NL676_021979 [Syzygium grande]|nr:hypothetical protein NL676_021979 [Syzygium grande]
MGDVVVPEVLLSSGERMPLISMGCAASPPPPLDVLTSIFLEAIEAGYRHFDTAAMYGNEGGARPSCGDECGMATREADTILQREGIQVSAWSPLGANGAAWGTLAVVESPVLKEIAIARGKTVAQVALRWIYEQGACVIVKSFNKERMKENLQILEWELSQEDSDKIKLQIPQKRGSPVDIFISEDGPYKSLDELWDGDA